MDIKIHLRRDDKFNVAVPGGNDHSDWLDVVLPGGRIELFLPLDRSAEFAECLLRAAVELLERARERGRANDGRKEDDAECPDPPTVPNY